MLTLMIILTLVGSRCIHDEISEGLPEIARSESEYTREGETLEATGMRVKFLFGKDYCRHKGETVSTEKGLTTECRTADVLTLEKRKIIDEMLEKASGWIQEALEPVKKPSKIHVRTQKCSLVEVPSCIRKNGLESVDFAAFVSAFPMSDSSSTTLAYSTPCQEDETGRTIAGHINIVPSALVAHPTDEKYHNEVMVIIHELMHALGLSSRFWSDTNNNHNPRYGWFKGQTLPITQEINGTLFLTSSRVKQEARAHFGCDTIPGIPIERHGGTGSKGSHWEQLFLGPEAMTYTIASVTPVMMSRITLAYFEDTGFYHANYSVADRAPVLHYGKGTCMQYKQCNGRDMCKHTGKYQCNPDRTGVAWCSSFEECNTLSDYYLCASPHPDPCSGRPYNSCTEETFEQSCRWNAKENTCYDHHAETRSPTSRCFNSDIISNINTKPPSSARDIRCFHTECDATTRSYTVRLQNGGSVSCTHKLEIHENIKGYTGNLHCAEFDIICDSSHWKGYEEQLLVTANGSLPSGDVRDDCEVEPVMTLNGCECQATWEVAGKPSHKCVDSCCSFEHEAKWCFVVSTVCEGSLSGPCETLGFFSTLRYRFFHNREVVGFAVICGGAMLVTYLFKRWRSKTPQEDPQAVQVPTQIPIPDEAPACDVGAAGDIPLCNRDVQIQQELQPPPQHIDAV
eukprot:TRINITY_DN173_c2_g2_i1.p1 TRINITY_DN173_c2_g2~~TRINITY_DN173_c2_g2_i1.p1  ORF type:complete len:698 (+),score=74.02 TRINITY_DN173_c2_g2_i1:46-2094(+)